jgi:hypothetical protein
MLPKLQADLSAQRLASPARQVDAVLRQLETVGTLDQVAPLLWLSKVGAATSWGKWKFYATIQGILSRHSVEQIGTILPPPGHPQLVVELAPLVRDLEPAKAGRLAVAMLDQLAERAPNQPRGANDWWTAEARLWLAWSASYVDPERAFAIFKDELACSDPAWRLLAGMGIMRITGSAPPFCLTAPSEQTAEARREWLGGLSLHAADPWRTADPLSVPFIMGTNGSPELRWLDKDGHVVRRLEGACPVARAALPDGSLYSRLRGSAGVALTSPTGEVYTRFPEVWSTGVPADHGGLWGLCDGFRMATEYAATGELLWACPTSQDNCSAREIAGAGPGRVLLVRYGRVELLNRRGDVLRVVQDNLDDPRYAGMAGRDLLLVCCSTELVVYDLNKGERERLAGFRSMGAVRCSFNGPWVLFDGSSYSVTIYDPVEKTRIVVSLRADSQNPTSQPMGER